MQKQADSVVSGTNAFINFWLRLFNTRRERHNSYYANHPQRSAHLVEFKISVGRDPKILIAAATEENSTTRLHGRNSSLDLHSQMSTPQLYASMAKNSLLCLHGPISTLFKILKFSGPSLLGMTSSTLQPYFLSGVYYDNGDRHILCKLYPMTVHLN